MKKNFLRIFLVVLIIIAGILLQDKALNYATLIKISNATKRITQKNRNIQVRVTEKYNDGSEKIAETYIKDGILVTRRIDSKNEPSNSLDWYSKNTDEICNSYYEYEFEYNGKVVKGLNCGYDHTDDSKNKVSTRIALGNLLLMYDKDLPMSSGNMYTNIFNMPKIEDVEYDGKICYALRTEYKTWYIDKDNLLTIAIECKMFEDDSPCFYKFEYDIEAPEGIYEPPKAAYYDKVEFFEIGYSNGRKKIKEKPISGTNLSPGEELIETVEVKENEKLNFLELTENNFGLQGLNIYTLSTYNKFREKYSGLRELTEEDFKGYYVGIAYKEGYKLDYLQSILAKEANTTNYIFDAEKNETESFVLIVTPKIENSIKSVFIRNNEKLNIDEDTAKKALSENIKELNSELVLDSENYINVEYTEIVILDNKTFAKLDSIKTPVKGNEPICWKMTIVDSENKKIEAYVNAITGEVIGSKNR